MSMALYVGLKHYQSKVANKFFSCEIFFGVDLVLYRAKRNGLFDDIVVSGKYTLVHFAVEDFGRIMSAIVEVSTYRVVEASKGAYSSVRKS